MGVSFTGNAADLLEAFTKVMKTMDNDHAYIHAKKKYSGFYKATIATGETLLISIQTPSDKYMHFRGLKLSPSADKVSVDYYEGATINVAGTAVPISNRSRTDTVPTSEAVIKYGTTFSANGTLLGGLSEWLPGSTGTGNVRIGGGNDAGEEIVLAPSTTYRIVITNGSSGSNVIGIKMDWYEEENG